MHPDGTVWCPCGAYLPFDSTAVVDPRQPRRVGRGLGRLIAAALGLLVGLAAFQCGNLGAVAPGVVSDLVHRGPPPARPIPYMASVCAGAPASTTASGRAEPIPGLALRIDDRGVAGRALLALSADLGVDPDAEIRLDYSVDGGPAQENAFGPANLADHQQFGEGRLATAVVPLTAGVHTVTPYWRISGIAGKGATLGQRCLTAIGAPDGLAASSPVVPAAVCSDRNVAIDAAGGPRPVPDLALRVDGDGARTLLVELSGDLLVPPDAEVRLAYSVDGKPAEEYAFGPGNLASHQQFLEVRAATAVIPLPPGKHRITPYWRVTGGEATISKRCLTAVSVGTNVAASSPIVSAAACAGGAAEATPSAGAQAVPGIAVKVDNGTRPRKAAVILSGDVDVDPDAEVRVAYSVDGGPPDEDAFGTAKLASHQQHSETRAITAVIPLPDGPHTITPFWRLNGPPGKHATFGTRCLTVLSAT